MAFLRAAKPLPSRQARAHPAAPTAAFCGVSHKETHGATEQALPRPRGVLCVASGLPSAEGSRGGAGAACPRALSVGFTLCVWPCPAGRGAMAEVWTIAESVRRVVAERDLPAQS